MPGSLGTVVAAKWGISNSRNVCSRMPDLNLFSDIFQIRRRHDDQKRRNNSPISMVCTLMCETNNQNCVVSVVFVNHRSYQCTVGLDLKYF